MLPEVLKFGERVLLPPDPTSAALVPMAPSAGHSHVAVDLVFPVLHGTFGEDGTVQGLLDLAGLPGLATSRSRPQPGHCVSKGRWSRLPRSTIVSSVSTVTSAVLTMRRLFFKATPPRKRCECSCNRQRLLIKSARLIPQSFL